MNHGMLGAFAFWIGLVLMAVSIVRWRMEHERRIRAFDRGQALAMLHANQDVERRDRGSGSPYRDAVPPEPAAPPVLWTPEREIAARAAGAHAELQAVLRLVRSMAGIERELRARGAEVQDTTATILALLEDRQVPLPVPPAPPPIVEARVEG